MYELNGEQVDLARLKELAGNYNMDVNTYIQKMTDKGRLVVKQGGAAATDAGAVPQIVPVGMESASVDTSLGQPSTSEDELPEDKGWFEDMFTAISGGAKAGSGVGEAFDVYRQGRYISEKDLESFIVAANAMSENSETN